MTLHVCCIIVLSPGKPDIPSYEMAFLTLGAAGSSCQSQEVFPNWPLLPHRWSGYLHVRTGDGIYLRLSLLLHTSGQLTLPPRQALNVLDNKQEI